jgi:DNA-binding CsgD family transcriptional regulator
MSFNSTAASALLAALRLAREHGSADAALQNTGIDLPDVARYEGLSQEIGGLPEDLQDGSPLSEALALGFLAGRLAYRSRRRTPGDPTSFVMDRELLVRGAEGESILRLPWFEQELFVGRQLPDIAEMPRTVRSLCVKHYGAALQGERGSFEFLSFGHAYTVDAVPVRSEAGSVEAVLAVAVPVAPHLSAATAYEQTAGRMQATAESAERRADTHAREGRADAAAEELRAARKARKASEHALLNARRLRARDAPEGPDVPTITPRENEVLRLASHGLTSPEIAEQLGVSTATIRTHLENTYVKLGAKDKVAAVAAALRHGLID